MKKFLIAVGCGTALGLFTTAQIAGPLVAQEAARTASVYEQLDLFGDIFERIRADYVEEVDPGADTGRNQRRHGFGGADRVFAPLPSRQSGGQRRAELIHQFQQKGGLVTHLVKKRRLSALVSNRG